MGWVPNVPTIGSERVATAFTTGGGGPAQFPDTQPLEANTSLSADTVLVAAGYEV